MDRPCRRSVDAKSTSWERRHAVKGVGEEQLARPAGIWTIGEREKERAPPIHPQREERPQELNARASDPVDRDRQRRFRAVP
jgi:hypothetical protein